MPDFGFPSKPSLFSRTLRECRELYISAPGNDAEIELMDDLHRGLVLKVYLLVVEADRKWSKEERFYGEVLCHHLWGSWLGKEALRETIKRASRDSASLKWEGLLGPFGHSTRLRSRVAEIETLISRLGNLIARCDGNLNERERAVLQSIEQEVTQVLNPMTLEEAAGDDTPVRASPPVDASRQVEQAQQSATDIYHEAPPGKPSRKPTKLPVAAKSVVEKAPSVPELSVEEALEELDRLIGLGSIKHEVRSLANFLKLQQRREQAGLPETEVSLHMVFTGNPGTGKTTVARIVAKIFGALGVLEKGHLVETDRSGLVAEYAGQTGPKTNKKVDEALEGLLFVDEAYSLVATDSDDPYGREAAQALLKRAEDDRHRLVVTLAGYPEEMDALLRTNPGLSSRFNRKLHFEDYQPEELCRIFGLMCDKNHYRLTSAARLKVMLGMHALFERRDRHFGNGRAARNLFEHAVRRMANRLADQAEATQEQLMTLESTDIEFTALAAALFESLDEQQVRVRLACPACEHANEAPTQFLGNSVKCPKCQQQFTAEWGTLVGKANASNEQSTT